MRTWRAVLEVEVGEERRSDVGEQGGEGRG